MTSKIQKLHTDNAEGVASSVTPHEQNPLLEGSRPLLCGFDSLDIGMNVKWFCAWGPFMSRLAYAKAEAQNSEGLMDETSAGRRFMHFPRGKEPSYRFHLVFSEFHMFISTTKEALTTPNVYISFKSNALWRLGVARLVDMVTDDIACLGGEVEMMKPSRVDFCADFKLPVNLTQEFLSSQKVARSSSENIFVNDGRFEAYYVGSKSAAIQLRIYDKGREVLKSKKLWFTGLWGTDENNNIWRVEFQARRPVLKQFQIHTLADLEEHSFGIWRYLTEDWFSLRLPNNKKTERRTIHPWWSQVQECAKKFGKEICSKRTINNNISSENWYLPHIAGCLPSYAALCGAKDFNGAMDQLTLQLNMLWAHKNFEEEVIKKAINFGLAQPNVPIRRDIGGVTESAVPRIGA